MNTIETFISTYRLKNEYPQSSALLSYLKFECSQTISFKQQMMIQRPFEIIAETEEDFIKKLATGGKKDKKKKKEVNFSEFPIDPKEINFVNLAR